MDNYTIEKLIEIYIENAHIHRQASLEDSQKANEAYSRLNNAFLALEKLGPSGISEFLKLLDSENEDVRGWAASHALNINEGKAISVLRELQKKGGLTGVEAEYTILNWERKKNDPRRN